MVLPSLVDMMGSGPTGIPMRARTPSKVGMIPFEILGEMHCDKGESLENLCDFWVGSLGRGQIMRGGANLLNWRPMRRKRG